MLYKITILTALLSVSFGNILEKEDGSRRLLNGYDPYNGGSPSYGGRSYGGYNGGSYGGGSYGGQFDGTYNFNCLGEDLQLNICGNNYNNEIYASITKINLNGLLFANFVFAALRDIDGANNGILNLNGFQYKVSGQGYDAVSYTFTQNADNSFTLSQNGQIFTLTKTQNIQNNECFQAGRSFNDPSIEYPLLFDSDSLEGSGLCTGDEAECHDMEFISNSVFADACFNIHDVPTDIAFAGAPFEFISTEWEGRLVLTNFEEQSFKSDRAACKLASQMFINDPYSSQIVISWRCSEGNLGYTYRLNPIIGTETCPLFVPNFSHKRDGYRDNQPQNGYRDNKRPYQPRYQ